ncbi:MAG: cation:proton antiporter [Candidatus ainarchaeum sp.]|nr:cation:proton antiporter [Candidatus ainarchaeum sp.]
MALDSVSSSFLIFGGILLIGYIGDLLSKRFSIPSALLLLLIGFLLQTTGYVDTLSLMPIQELFGSLALIILLFDGGLSTNIFDVLLKSGRVMVVAVLMTIFGIISAILIFIALGLDPLLGAILGAISGGIGASVTISIIRSLNIPDNIRNFLTLESSITDVLSIILALVLIEALISGSIDIQLIGQGILSKFSIGILLGFVIGLFSLALMSKIQKGYNYMMAFALVLVLYALVEYLGGSGAISVLTFGLVFGNESAIRNFFKINPGEEHHSIKQFQAEVSFFIRTFFFVFLGAIVTLGDVTNLFIALLFIILIYIARYVSVKFVTSNTEYADYSTVLSVINARGLATAVLATYPVFAIKNALIQNPTDYLTVLLDQAARVPEIAFYIIIISILFTTILVPYFVGKANGNNKKPKKSKKAKAEEEELEPESRFEAEDDDESPDINV